MRLGAQLLWLGTLGAAAACGHSAGGDENAPDARGGGGGHGSDAGQSDGGPTCAVLGGTCSSSSSCCDGLECVQGACTRCDAEHPKYCPQLGGACWTDNAACESIVDCGDAGWGACTSDAVRFDCATQTCSCPDADYPVFCGDDSALPDQCWSQGTDCATRTQCDGFVGACREGYAGYDCSSHGCTADIPSWIAGTWYQTGKTENNVTFDSDDWSVELDADGSYANTYGSSGYTSNGTFTWNPSTNSISFSGGSLAGRTVALGTTCRTIPGLKFGIYRHSEIPQCPVSAYVQAAACGAVGTYTKTTTSGSIGDSGSGSETDSAYTVRLYRDGFYTYDQSSFKTTCYSYTCSYSSNHPQTEVGRWGLNSSNVYVYQASSSTAWYDLGARLAGYAFEASSVTCPGP